MTDKTALEIIDCLKILNPDLTASVYRGQIYGTAGSCARAGEVICNRGFRLDPVNIKFGRLTAGWSYPAPECEVTREVVAIITASIREADDAERARRPDVANARSVRTGESDFAQMDRSYLFGATSRRDAQPNGKTGTIGETELFVAAVGVFQSSVTDDTLLIETGARLFDAQLGLLGGYYLRRVTNVAGEFEPEERAVCSFEAVVFSDFNYDAFFPNDDQGVVYARHFKMLKPSPNVRSENTWTLSFVNDG